MKKLLLIIFLLSTQIILAQKIVSVHLYVRDTVVTFGGVPRHAIAVNGQIPMPTLIFTEGDTAEFFIHNELSEETSIHWHGLVLPNAMDGVPYLTTPPIKPHTTQIHRFALIQNGTYWYHSHTKLQEQSGMYGAFIIHKKEKAKNAFDKLPEYAMILSDWTNEKPFEVHRKLHNASDYYAIRKGTVQSYGEAIRDGYFKTKVANEWKRMNAMDVSDIAYDKFLINGKDEFQLGEINNKKLKAGDKVRLRIANGGSSSYFWLNYAGGKMTVIASDGKDVQPVEVDRLIIAVSETYDIVVTIPADKTSFEFQATPEDRTKSVSFYIGNGVKQTISAMPKLKYFEGMKMMNDMMKMNGDLDDMGMSMSLNKMDMNVVMYPEITGEEKLEMDSMKMDDMKMDDKKTTVKKTDTKMDGMKMDDKKTAVKKSDTKMDGMKMDDKKTAVKKSDTKMDGMKMDMGKEKMDANMYNGNALSDIKTLNYAMLKSPTKTNLPSNAPMRVLKFELTGNMNRYLWSMDGKTVSETDKILIKQGENIRIILYNGSMMRHPMHLHGHFFRVLNGQGDYAPLKNVLDIMPMETDTIEFNASEKSGDWFFHCHILYHMMSGMGRIFQYENSIPNPELGDKKAADRQVFKDDRMYHLMANNDFATNGNDGMAMLSNTRWNFKTEWRLGFSKTDGYETETHFGRYIDRMQWLMPFVGFDWRYRATPLSEIGNKNLFGQVSTKDKRNFFSVGVEYTLPMLVKSQFEIFTDGNVRFQLMREDIPVTKRLRVAFMVNTDKEYMAGLKYIVAKNFALSTHYDSDMGAGVGVTVNY